MPCPTYFGEKMEELSRYVSETAQRDAASMSLLRFLDVEAENEKRGGPASPRLSYRSPSRSNVASSITAMPASRNIRAATPQPSTSAPVNVPS